MLQIPADTAVSSVDKVAESASWICQTETLKGIVSSSTFLRALSQYFIKVKLFSRTSKVRMYRSGILEAGESKPGGDILKKVRFQISSFPL